MAQTKVLFLGDSLTEGYGVRKEDAYPALIEKKLSGSDKKIKAINGGVSGSTTSSGLRRLKWQLKAKPEILVLALGANDGLRGIPVKTSKKNLDAIISYAKTKDLDILLTGMYLPENYGKAYRDQFSKMFSDLAKKHKISFIPFLLKDVARVKDLNISDGIHPNEKGHEIMSKTVLKELEKLL